MAKAALRRRLDLLKAYDPNQTRDERGRWADSATAARRKQEHHSRQAFRDRGQPPLSDKEFAAHREAAKHYGQAAHYYEAGDADKGDAHIQIADAHARNATAPSRPRAFRQSLANTAASLSQSAQSLSNLFGHVGAAASRNDYITLAFHLAGMVAELNEVRHQVSVLPANLRELGSETAANLRDTRDALMRFKDGLRRSSSTTKGLTKRTGSLVFLAKNLNGRLVPVKPSKATLIKMTYDDGETKFMSRKQLLQKMVPYKQAGRGRVHQPTDFGIFTPRIGRGERQRGRRLARAQSLRRPH